MAAVAQRTRSSTSAKDPGSSESHRYSSQAVNGHSAQDENADHVEQGSDNEFASRRSRTNDSWTVTKNYQSESYTSLSATQLTDSKRVKIYSTRQVDRSAALRLVRFLAYTYRSFRSRILVNSTDIDKLQARSFESIVPSPRLKPLHYERSLSSSANDKLPRNDRIKKRVPSEVSIIAVSTEIHALCLLRRSIPSNEQTPVSIEIRFAHR